MDNRLTPSHSGVEIKIPVRVFCFAPNAADLIAIRRAEEIVNEDHQVIGDLEDRHPRCSFVLEPMVAQCETYERYTSTIETMIRQNEWISSISFRTPELTPGDDDLVLKRRSLHNFFTNMFSSTRRSSDLATTKYECELHGPRKGSFKCPLQLEKVDVYTGSNMTMPDFEALFLAIVVGQTTRTLHLEGYITPRNVNRTTQWWKCVAYTFFSERARRCSTVKWLHLSSPTLSMSVDDVEAFLSVLTSEILKKTCLGVPTAKSKCEMPR